MRLTSSLPIQGASLCNLLEEEEAALTWQDGGVSLEVLPFKILTVNLKVYFKGWTVLIIPPLPPP